MDVVPKQKINVLIVEDVLIAQKIAVLLFEKNNCAAVAVNNGAMAMEAIKNQKFDFILMDLCLPDTDGVTLTKALRTKGGWLADVPIVAITAHVDESFKSSALRAGITDFRLKPITISLAQSILEANIYNRSSLVEEAT